MNYISEDVLKVLEAWTDKEIIIGFTFEGNPYIRFGYWDSVNLDDLNDILKPIGFTAKCCLDWKYDINNIFYYPLKQL